MSKYYLLFISPSIIHESFFTQQSRVFLNVALPTTSLQVGDLILPVRDNADKIILPCVYTIEAINRSTGSLTLNRKDIYQHHIELDKLQHILPVIRRQKIQQLVEFDFAYIVAEMGGSSMEEVALLDYIEDYITAKGYYFERETLRNYHICLKTRPFAILAGLSGTGKSKLSQLYAEALGHKQHYLRLPVSPNWNDDRYLLGYFDTISDSYMTETAADFIIAANAHPDDLYFLCLDEMNLAHVEHYFSQFLSAMEEEDPDERTVRLMSDKTYQQLLVKDESLTATLKLPKNLLFTGTINVDETTKSISDKVIDRANTLEFFTVDLAKVPNPADELPELRPQSALTWQSYAIQERDTAFRARIIEIAEILRKADMGLGFRILKDIELYLANSQGLLEPLVAFDLQVKQRILPRVRGTEVIKSTIDELLTFMRKHQLPRSEQRLIEMKHRLQRDGYTSFWR